MKKQAISIIIAAGMTSIALGQNLREFSVSPGQKLILDMKTGASVEVLGWERSAVEISYENRGSQNCRIEFNEVSEGLEILSYFDGDRSGSRCRLSLSVRVPGEFDIELDSMGGGLTVADVSGHFTGKTMGGALILERVAGEARLTTMGGKIRLMDSELDGSLSTMGGEVLFKNVVGDVKGSSMGGNVRYENVRRPDGGYGSPRGVSAGEADSDTVQISTMGGQIDVDDAPAGASVSTMGGDIRIAKASRFVRAKTMGGDIEMHSVDGWVKATTMGGDIDVQVEAFSDEGDRSIELTSMSGDVTLTVPADMSLEFDVEIAFTRNSDQNYRIISDFALTQETDQEWDYRHGSARKFIYGTGSTGGGEHLVRIETVNGNIRIMKAR